MVCNVCEKCHPVGEAYMFARMLKIVHINYFVQVCWIMCSDPVISTLCQGSDG